MSGDRLQRILVWMLIIAVAVYLLGRLYSLTVLFATPLLLFSLAWVFALVVKPLVDWMTSLALPIPFIIHRSRITNQVVQTWCLPRVIAVSLVYLAIVVLVVLVVLSLVPVVQPQLEGVDATLPAAVDAISKAISGMEQELRRLGYRGDLEQVIQPESLIQQATTLGNTLIQQSLGIASSIASVLINLVLVIILSFYMTLDGPRLAARLLEILPPAWRADTERFYLIVNSTFGGFLRAQLIQGLIYGIATAIVMAILGLNYIALVSVIAAIVVLVPLIGGLLAVIPPLLIVLVQRPDRFLLMLIALIIVQQVLFNMIMPRLMGRIVGLHPLLVFAAILVGAAVAGGWGILFGIPIAGVVTSVLQFVYTRATGEPALETPSAPSSPNDTLAVASESRSTPQDQQSV